MVTKGYGEVHPIASNRYAEGRSQNRRIEIKILPPQDPES
jgi:outer membrane protein OmpA-like peptidoglycan-associated protein